MDADRFDRIAIALSTPRRAVLRAAVAGAVGVLVAAARPAAAACRVTSKPCRRGRDCCSGVCKKGTCRPTQGLCAASADSCGGAVFCTFQADCACWQSPVFGRPSLCAGTALICDACEQDRQCVQQFGPGWACVLASPACCASDRGCVPPCTRRH